jgi:2-oxoglutarate ferredoxin oxidoreductase subunit beta
MNKAMEWGDQIPTGIIYRNDRPSFETRFGVLEKGPLTSSTVDKDALRDIIRAMK